MLASLIFSKKKNQHEGKNWTRLWEVVTTERSHRKNTVTSEVSFQKAFELFHWNTLKSNL